MYICMYIYICVYIYIYMHVREVYEFYKLSEGYRLLFWTCEPTNLSWASICSHLCWPGDGPFWQAMFEAWHGASLGQLHRQMDSVLLGAPQPNLSRHSDQEAGKKGDTVVETWESDLSGGFLAWIDTDCPCVRRMEYPFGAWRCKTSRWTTPRGKPVAWHRAAWDGQKAAGRIIYMIYL